MVFQWFFLKFHWNFNDFLICFARPFGKSSNKQWFSNYFLRFHRNSIDFPIFLATPFGKSSKKQWFSNDVLRFHWNFSVCVSLCGYVRPRVFDEKKHGHKKNKDCTLKKKHGSRLTIARLTPRPQSPVPLMIGSWSGRSTNRTAPTRDFEIEDRAAACCACTWPQALCACVFVCLSACLWRFTW